MSQYGIIVNKLKFRTAKDIYQSSTHTYICYKSHTIVPSSVNEGHVSCRKIFCSFQQKEQLVLIFQYFIIF
jgi:hypothetical protein